MMTPRIDVMAGTPAVAAEDVDRMFPVYRTGCQRCGKDRALKLSFGSGLHYKGEEICRPCSKAVRKGATS